MKRFLCSFVLICIFACGGDAHGAAPKRDSKKKKPRSASTEARAFGHKVERAFLNVGGHLQKFFTGRDTISR